MQRKMMTSYSSVTFRDQHGNVIRHSEGEHEHPVPLKDDPEVFAAFKAAIIAGEHIFDIAQRFQTDLCLVLHWKNELLKPMNDT